MKFLNHSVQFAKKGFDIIYQFRVRNIPAKGDCILVREDSQLIVHLKVGDVLDTKYFAEEESNPFEISKTKITDIAKDDCGRFEGHYLIGLAKLGG